MTWRDHIRPIVAEIVERVGRDDPKALRRALLNERPYWVKQASHMTKVWRDEVNFQLGIKQKRQAEKSKQKAIEAMQAEAEAGQSFLFDQ